MELPAVNLKTFLRPSKVPGAGASGVFCTRCFPAPVVVMFTDLFSPPCRTTGDSPRSLAADNLFLGGLLATIFLDIVHISIFYPRTSLTDTGRFGVGMAILSLLLKPLSCCFVYHMYRERGGELLVHTGFLGPSQDRSAYQTIDSAEAPTDPFAVPEGRGSDARGY
ncbi:type-1 angiotensin II receptor-associated protein isoform X2 [Piliocolobus tephrosceles]|uniref:type-1 angiotensin II receptor-associated protein isoform X2 n=2 Tax=Piliocolobus tephrosceles TaxID=591936 RepID=UPI000C2A2F5E|nr:type-1 angiotensin II receptor-associated protein isoform X2 [Piliocolobus tephrosceles]